MTKGEKLRGLLAVLLALGGGILLLVRIWGMRFSGLLALCASAALLLSLMLDREACCSKGWRWARRGFYGCLAVGLALLTLLESYIVYQGRPELDSPPADAVIVLGAGVNGTEPSLSLRIRLEAALDYLEDHPDIPVVLTGGTGHGEQISEAQCMYDYLTARGVDGGRLLLEEQAGNTAENFALSAALLARAGVEADSAAIAVVSNDFHIARALLLARRQGWNGAFGVPARLPWRHLAVNYYLREAFALVKTLVLD